MDKKNMDKKNFDNIHLPTTSDVSKFEMLFPMIQSDLSEIRELSKKKQDESLNDFKVKILNKKLAQIKELLKNESSFEFLELLNEDVFPSNSDALLTVSQFINAMKQYQGKYYESNGNDLDWGGAKFSWNTKD
jgi:hypothetical protein